MTIDQKSIDDMAKIMKMLGGKDIGVEPETASSILEESESLTIAQEVAPAAVTSSVSTPDIDAMKSILMKFHNAETTSTSILSEDRELAEAVVTDRTQSGVRIGSWEITTNNGPIKSYDVVNTSGVLIAKDLYLYDSALGIARRLNEGFGITDPKVRDFLKLEEDYAKNLNDARNFKMRAKSLREKGENMRASVAEDRFDDSQRNALSAHDEILRLAGLRR